eukprot:CAMPEP_0198255660 /NCGR_PEP_ID=MMETSP1447-20131203/5730_1 /TAXON_ID=420782 /ORGANISM="Chaetoceros dichaeta, Strain CCMP1751" /LENGTH=54 /DNA_ID=CAMNT_0043942079 /DNA_START=944 /DNA_END=1105 /DNA_ORIENTATION=+
MRNATTSSETRARMAMWRGLRRDSDSQRRRESGCARARASMMLTWTMEFAQARW